MAEIARLIGRALRCRADEAELRAVRDDVTNLCGKFTPYPR
jgi:glycine/serine hydroxymethyltransferase